MTLAPPVAAGRNYVERKLSEVESQLAAGEPSSGIIAEMLRNGEDVTREDIIRIVADLFLAAGDTVRMHGDERLRGWVS